MIDNIEDLMTTIIEPLIEYPEELVIKKQETNNFMEYLLYIHPEDVGRVIGRKGRVIRAIRTIVYSVRNHSDKRIRVTIMDDNDSENV